MGWVIAVPGARAVNPWVILGVLLAVIVAGAAGYGKGRSDGKAKVEAQDAHDKQLIDDAAKRIDTDVAGRIAGIEVQRGTIVQRVHTEVVEKPVYRDCVNTADGLSLINSALTGVGPAPAGHRELPAPDPARRP